MEINAHDPFFNRDRPGYGECWPERQAMADQPAVEGEFGPGQDGPKSGADPNAKSLPSSVQHLKCSELHLRWPEMGY